MRNLQLRVKLGQIRKLLIIGVAVLSLAGFGYGEQPTFQAGKRLEVPNQTELEGPEAVDFDRDGKIDLLSGLYNGHLLFRRNVGSLKSPEFDKPIIVQSNSQPIKLRHW